MTIPCQIITLEPQSARMGALRKAFEEQGVQVSVFPAVDGRNAMPELLPDEQLDQDAAIRRRKAPLSNSEVGCYLSHLRLIRQAYAEGFERIAVFEDDIGLEDGMKEALDAVEALPDSFEFVRLMGLRVRQRKEIRRLDEKHVVVRPLRGVKGTQGYVVNRRGMEKIIQRGSRIDQPIDIFLDTYWENDLQNFCIEPHLIYELNHATSIVKEAKKMRSISLIRRIGWQLRKPFKSIRRLLYLMRHRNDFYPSRKPIDLPGRTERMW